MWNAYEVQCLKMQPSLYLSQKLEFFFLKTILIVIFFPFNQVFLKDTDERACAYLAGPAPNRWGFTVDGEDLFESMGDTSTTYGEFMLDT